MYIHNLDPVIFSIGPIALRWYSLSYIGGIILGYFYILYLNDKLRLKLISKKELENLIFNIVVGVILGGRLGYVIFYNFLYYFYNPLEIIYIWQGGMSFHGGLIGFTIGVLYYCWKNNKSFLQHMDILACSVPIGLFLGRLANFINGELYGRYTNSNWGVVFADGSGLPRHPSQLYEAFGEGIITFFILFFAVKNKSVRDKRGALAGIFLICYSVARIIIENFREADMHIGYFWEIISLGQILSLPMLFLGIYLTFIRRSLKLTKI